MSRARHWEELLQGMGDFGDVCEERFFRDLSCVLRSMLSRRLDVQSVEDCLQDVVLIILGTLRRGGLRNPTRLVAFAVTVAKRQAAAHIRRAIRDRCHFAHARRIESHEALDHSPEGVLQKRERYDRLQAILHNLKRRDSQLLIRSYLYEQSEDQIRTEMRLSRTQFRLYKSRAIARCSAAARQNATCA